MRARAIGEYGTEQGAHNADLAEIKSEFELASNLPVPFSIIARTKIFLRSILVAQPLQSTTQGVSIGALKSIVIVAVAGGMGFGAA